MPWIELHIKTTAELANELSDKLDSFGAEAVTFQDAGNQPIFEPSPETPRLWQETIVIGLFSIEQPIEPVIQFLENPPPPFTAFTFHLNYLPDEDWQRRCLESFKPLCFGKRLWICPSWHRPPELHAVNVILDPGLAFGTGTHPTTSLCLEWLDENIHADNLVIDYGCGSGILAIAALKLGAKRVLAIDNDPQALEATRANSDRNLIDSTRLITLLPHELTSQKADILIANILAKPLIDLASHFASQITTGGKIVLSGILSEQINEVIIAYEPWFRIKNPVYKEEWARLEGIKT